MSAKILRNDIAPSCSYCLFSKQENGHFICTKKNREEPSGMCRKFVYYPFDRIPQQQPRLKTYSKEDFKI
ncbi:MAG: hypothetical protein IJP10_03695 [Clostridia bacterium]|nr:hypothetical protein [Oscillospiraceae bacterium]MBQ6797098.1 hypothetical protein [Clostridia bacterium]